MKLPELNKKEFLEAISNGVKDAILTMTETGDGYTGPICFEPFLFAIQKGVTAAFNPEVGSLCEDVCEKMESVSENLDALSTEIYKLRKDLDQNSENPSNKIWVN